MQDLKSIKSMLRQIVKEELAVIVADNDEKQIAEHLAEQKSITLPNKISAPAKPIEQPKPTPKARALKIAKAFKASAIAKDGKVGRIESWPNSKFAYVAHRAAFGEDAAKDKELVKELKELGFIVGGMEGRTIILPVK